MPETLTPAPRFFRTTLVHRNAASAFPWPVCCFTHPASTPPCSGHSPQLFPWGICLLHSDPTDSTPLPGTMGERVTQAKPIKELPVLAAMAMQPKLGQ